MAPMAVLGPLLMQIEDNFAAKPIFNLHSMPLPTSFQPAPARQSLTCRASVDVSAVFVAPALVLDVTVKLAPAVLATE